jgi:hypothetical protein
MYKRAGSAGKAAGKVSSKRRWQNQLSESSGAAGRGQSVVANYAPITDPGPGAPIGLRYAQYAAEERANGRAPLSPQTWSTNYKTGKSQKGTRVRSAKPAAAEPAGIWPVSVTDGMKPDGTLNVRIFNSRSEADAAGFDWVGR